jgi:hypothetical protein
MSESNKEREREKERDGEREKEIERERERERERNRERDILLIYKPLGGHTTSTHTDATMRCATTD